AKLGLPDNVEDAAAGPLIEELLTLLQQHQVDYTAFFRRLSGAARGDTEPVRGLCTDPAALDTWLGRWRALRPDAAAMDRVNPVYIPRNHLVEEALAAATDGELSLVEQLLDAVTAPYDDRPGLQRYATPAPADFGAYRTFCGT
ncbi:MAG TPA: protein adenylyltransferase SelO family protein, partial [Mycobacterium sp.]|nr:protein adenylyltransferase SelO family protein [Mycobacterium sp.]